ncbi:hypothetical protein OHB41_49575 [Streptomyces sp. NBC_01571]|uniref:hypothetical protein n=1 Tax=Streptomyces sp. NBC_01571 TaxID=2975883 RepID=UPI00225A5E0E|nr:hypothetical protein [Streptomyces sp. NBC_01571]MCX4581013.1 hypothetical protein [Streptomyces sp. NBC_01571]
MLTTVHPAQGPSTGQFPHLAFLTLTDIPHVSDRSGTTIAPYSACIAYEADAIAPRRTWHAQISAYRVLPNGAVDMDPAFIVLHSATDRDLLPDGLLARIEGRVCFW